QAVTSCSAVTVVRSTVAKQQGYLEPLGNGRATNKTRGGSLWNELQENEREEAACGFRRKSGCVNGLAQEVTRYPKQASPLLVLMGVLRVDEAFRGLELEPAADREWNSHATVPSLLALHSQAQRGRRTASFGARCCSFDSGDSPTHTH